MANLQAEITAYLHTRNLIPTPAWLSTFLPTIRANTPLPALQKTALFRLLATDITTTLTPTPTSTFPASIATDAATTPSRRLPGPLVVQVLDIEDIGRSRWSQVEAIEAAERGETTKGREVIRVVPSEEQEQVVRGAGTQTAARVEEVVGESKGPHKLLLQDARGVAVWGLEMQTVEGVGMGMSIGAKLVLRDVVIARGVVLLEPRGCTVLGGKIEGWHKAWKEGLKGRLLEKAAMGEREG